jgi:hypothetical protein
MRHFDVPMPVREEELGSDPDLLKKIAKPEFPFWLDKNIMCHMMGFLHCLPLADAMLSRRGR